MNIDLIRKFKKEFDWLLVDLKRTVHIKTDTGWKTDWSIRCFDVLSNGFNVFEIEEIEALVINDEYSKYRKAEADGEVILHFFKDGFYEAWLIKDVKNEFKGDVNHYKIKPSWNWQDEISEEKPVICHVWDSELEESVYSKDKHLIMAVNGTQDDVDHFLTTDVPMMYAEPITIADLHDFQRKGYYSIDEIAELEKEFIVNLHDGSKCPSLFLDWLRKREK